MADLRMVFLCAFLISIAVTLGLVYFTRVLVELARPVEASSASGNLAELRSAIGEEE